MAYTKMFTLQWHVTARCDQACKHCYMIKGKNYLPEINNELSLLDCKKIIDDFSATVKRWGVKGRISFVGGDPLLRKDFFEILRYAKQKGLVTIILGNPYHVTEETAMKLKRLGVKKYQISIDGKENTHDIFRRKGSFKDSLRAIKTLQKYGIKTVVMFTLSKANAKDLIPVIRLVSKLNVDEFDFNRLVPVGNGSSFKKELFEPKEYRDFLINVLKEYNRLEGKTNTKFGRKENLWKLLYYELGLIKKPEIDSEINTGGCSMGLNYMCLLADGTVYLCRRIEKAIGKLPEQKIRDVFLKSRSYDEVRYSKNYEKCSRCELGKVCRGCPAVSNAVNGSYLTADPQCWKEA